MSEDPRLGDIIKDCVGFSCFKDNFKADLVLIGFPHDEGVRRNGGRIGASEGPTAFRSYMRRICASDARRGVWLKDISICDMGDVAVGNSLELSHEALAERVFECLSHGAVPFVVGGGNDMSYGNVSGLLQYRSIQKAGNPRGVLVVNLDAHLDVRPLKNGLCHSGSPFRQMLEDSRWQIGKDRFVEFASQPSQCAIAHVEYAKSMSVEIMWLSDLKQQVNDKKVRSIPQAFTELLEQRGRDCDIFVSFDLDCVRACDAPGVSCSSPDGLSAEDAIEICLISGKNQNVKLIDVSEYNPPIESYRTGRLLAMMFHSFAIGIHERKHKNQ